MDTKDMSEPVTMSEFETTLNREVGQFGKYHLLTITLMFFPSMFSGFMAGDYIFTAGRLPHRCFVPGCDDTIQPQYAAAWVQDAIPITSSGVNDCFRFANTTNIVDQAIEDECPAYNFDRNITIPCETYVYERTNTIVYDFNLECQEWLRALSGMFNSLGGMVALPIAGYISDTYGRRVSIIVFAFNVALFGVIKSFSVNYPMYVALQFLQVSLGGGLFSAAYILASEIVGPKYRVATSATMSTMFTLGQVLLGAIASAIHEWRRLTLCLFTPCFVLISYHYLSTESHRWLLARNKTDRARNTLERASRLNGRKISDKSMNLLLNAIPDIEAASKSETTESNLLIQVLRSSIILRRCCTTPVMWIATTLIYYGLNINSVALSGNMYVNYIATVAIEIPGFWTAVLVLDRVGRKPTLFTGYLVCGLCCVGFAFTPSDMTTLSLVLYLTGKYCIGLVFTSLYLFTSELYPTKHRHSFLGFSSMMGRIGSVLAPLTPPLMDYWTGIPSMIFGVMAILSSFLILTLPETRGAKIPDTFEEAENIGTCD